MNYPYRSKALDKLGVRSWVNAENWSTTIGGSVLDERVIEAMAEVSRVYCNVQELLDKGAARIAQLCGVEAAYITSGSAAGIVLAATACITGNSRRKMAQLFGGLAGRETLPNEIVMQAAQSTGYDAQFYVGGARLIHVGHPDSIARFHVEAAICEKTVALAYVHSYHNSPKHLPFSVMADIAAKANLPLIVDCAAVVPPRENLHKFVAEGADLAIYSGGKAIRAPNNTGIILGGGRFGKQLIGAMREQAFPSYGVGRPFKVNKESAIALVTAVEIFFEEDEKARYEEQLRTGEEMAKALAGVPGLSARIVRNDSRDFEHPISALAPRVMLEWEAASVGFDAAKLDSMMAAGDPPIRLRPPRMTQGVTNNNEVRSIDLFFMRPGEPELVVECIKQAFAEGGRRRG
jgi:L-seryl-tRNA(Ser) seleniumtransferase